MTEEELNELDKKLEEAKNKATSSAVSTVSTIVKEEIDNQYEKSKQQLSKSEEFTKLTNEITERTARAKLGADMLLVLTEEQKNELGLYVLNCEKQKIDFRKKQEKGLIKEEVNADVFNKKVEVMKKRYGYLYKKDDKGQIIDFVPNKLYNKYRAFCNWWDNTTDGFKKIVKGIIKVSFWVFIGAVVLVGGYKLFKFVNSANIPNI